MTSPNRLPIVQVDAFTDRPFAGNPAAVCLLPEARSAAWMQSVATEMNLSETAFLERRADGWGLRWFTPGVEVNLCGHATLASAHVLWEEGHLGPEEPARFHTLSGLLTAERSDGRIEMDFPAEVAMPIEPPPGLVEALGAEPRWCGRNRLHFLAELESEEAVRALRPNIAAIAELPLRGVIITARSEVPGIDFVSRYFAPRAGVPEDPVTGSAHCTLAPFWAERFGRPALVGYQASARGGTVWVEDRGARVGLAGHAVTVLRGELVDRADDVAGVLAASA